MNNNQSSPDAISHKELNNLWNKAKKEVLSNQTSENNELKKNQEFNYLIKDWTKKSEEILLVLNQKDKTLTKDMTHKSLIAFGAMGAHINMALQALKATEFDQ